MKLCSGDQHRLRKSADRKAQISEAFFFLLTGLICALQSAGFLRWCLSPECNPLTHNLFLFPINFGFNFFFQLQLVHSATPGFRVVVLFTCASFLVRLLASAGSRSGLKVPLLCYRYKYFTLSLLVDFSLFVCIKCCF